MAFIVTYFLIFLQSVVSWALYSSSIFQLDEILVPYNATYFFTQPNLVINLMWLRWRQASVRQHSH